MSYPIRLKIIVAWPIGSPKRLCDVGVARVGTEVITLGRNAVGSWLGDGVKPGRFGLRRGQLPLSCPRLGNLRDNGVTAVETCRVGAMDKSSS